MLHTVGSGEQNSLRKVVGMEEIMNISCKVSLSTFILCCFYPQAPHGAKMAAAAPAIASS